MIPSAANDGNSALRYTSVTQQANPETNSWPFPLYDSISQPIVNDPVPFVAESTIYEIPLWYPIFTQEFPGAWKANFSSLNGSISF